jgi:predicted GNAT superfamily acetyltransferase
MQGFGRQAVTKDASDRKFTIVFENYPTYLYALVHGEAYGYEVLTAFLKQIADEVNARGFNQVLIEENISAGATKEDAYRVASEMPEMGFAGIRIAYVDRFLDQEEVNEFGRDVAVHNGIDVRLFNDQEMADRWLNS